MKIRDRRIVLVVFSVACLPFVLVSAEDGERAIKLKDLPKAVQAAVQEQSKGAVISDISEEKRGGQIFYEVEFEAVGRNRELLFDLAGEVVEVEEQVTLDSLPTAVRAEIIKQSSRCKLLQVASVSRGHEIVAYEARLRLNGKVSEIRVSTDGKFLGVEGDDNSAASKNGRP